MKIYTYELMENDSAIRCVVCRSISHEPHAVLGLECPQCGIKHEELAVRIERATRENAKREKAEKAVLKYSR